MSFWIYWRDDVLGTFELVPFPERWQRGGGGGTAVLPPSAAGLPVAVKGFTDAVGAIDGQWATAKHEHSLEHLVTGAGGLPAGPGLPELRLLGGGGLVVSIVKNLVDHRYDVTLTAPAPPVIPADQWPTFHAALGVAAGLAFLSFIGPGVVVALGLPSVAQVRWPRTARLVEARVDGSAAGLLQVGLFVNGVLVENQALGVAATTATLTFTNAAQAPAGSLVALRTLIPGAALQSVQVTARWEWV